MRVVSKCTFLTCIHEHCSFLLTQQTKYAKTNQDFFAWGNYITVFQMLLAEPFPFPCSGFLTFVQPEIHLSLEKVTNGN